MTSATISRVEASAYLVPTDAPEADATFSWTDTTLVVVQVSADGMVGVGWTYGSSATTALVQQTLAPQLIGRPVADISRLWQEMLIALRNIGRPGIGSMALLAVDCALWDLKARLLDLPLARLLGAVRDTVPLYGSGGFTSYSDEQLTRQLTGWVEDDGLRRVKIKIGEHWGRREGRDLARARQARDVVGPDVELFVDANGGYTVSQAVRVAARLAELDVRWFEEPVSSDDLAGLRQVRRASRAEVTAGEYGRSLDSFSRLCAAGAVDCVQVDVSRCGGITELLRIAAVAAAHHLEISGHCAPYQHASVLAAIPNLRHLEWFHDHVRIEQRFFEHAGDPVDSALPVGSRPGHGLEWRAETASEARVF